MKLTDYEKETLLRIESKINKKDVQDCWLWTGALGGHKVGSDHQYPSMHYKQKTARAHRVLYELTYGEIPKGFVLMHSCDNPKCMNLSHISLGTQQHNMRDAVIKGRINLPTPKYGEDNPNSKFTDEQVVQMRKDYQEGEFTSRGGAEKFGVNRSTFQRIINGKNYSHLPLFPRENKYMNHRGRYLT